MENVLTEYDRNKIKHDIKYDNIFKNIFGKIGNENLIKKLIELILNFEIENIDIRHDVSIDKILEGEKTGILDIMAIVNDKLIINIEMQKDDKGNILERTEKYGASIYSRNVRKGEKYENAKEVILITILNYKINDNKDYITDTITVIRQNRDIEVKTKIKRFFIELPKLDKNEIDMNDELNQWLVYIYGKDRRLVEMAIKTNEMIREIDRQVYYLQGEEAEARMQELRDKWDYTYMLGMKSAREEGRIEGIEKGKVEGKIEGEIIGEKKKAINIAKEMLNMNLDKDIILKATKLTLEELEEILNNK